MSTAAPIRFGTDGIRGPAGRFPMDAEGMGRIGRAVAAWAGPGQVVILGRDTRQSGPELAAALVAGLVEGGVLVRDGGVMPTAAVSCAVHAHGAAGGVVLTASHNPWQDNGVKVIDRGGGKLLDTAPLARWLDDAPTPGGGDCQPLPDPLGPWTAALPQPDLRGLHVLLDCAHGAAAHVAPGLLQALGARLTLRGCDPDGRNINDGVGSLHPPALDGQDLGVCLDGDADRLLMLDAAHGELDGDDLLWLLSRRSAGPVIGTVMSNGGLEEALGGRLHRTPVGDRYVAAAMLEQGADLGGEPSGHMLLAGGPPTSCGLYTALAVLAASAGPDGRPRLPLDLSGWARWPQVRHNVRSDKGLDGLTSVAAARGAGLRVLVRYSGTEPVVRVMVEGRDLDLAHQHADAIVQELQ